MAMLASQALVDELDRSTPCVQGLNDTIGVKNLRRMLFLVSKILAFSRSHLTIHQQEKATEALRFSAEKHASVYRKDGRTPYFMHLLEVANILLEMKVYDFKVLVSAILHDVVEDTKTTLKEIGKRFGSAIKNIVDLLSKHPNHRRKERYFELMREEVDLHCRWRVLVIKFADRIHNLMTLNAVPEDKRKSKLEETREEFPLLNKALAKTIMKLYKKGTLKKKDFLSLPFRLNNRLFYEMGRYT